MLWRGAHHKKARRIRGHGLQMLPQWAPQHCDSILPTLVRSLLGLEVAGDAKAVQAVAERAPAEGLVTLDDAVFLNDLFDLPQPPELRTLYDATDNAARNQGWPPGTRRPFFGAEAPAWIVEQGASRKADLDRSPGASRK